MKDTHMSPESIIDIGFDWKFIEKILVATNIKELDKAISSMNRISGEHLEKIKKHLVIALGTPSSCVDERKIAEHNDRSQIFKHKDGENILVEESELKNKKLNEIQSSGAGIPGGVLGFVQLYMILGLSKEKAIQNTVRLYQKMNWDLVIHNDEHNSEGQIEEQNFYSGCGYSGIYKKAADLTVEKMRNDKFKQNEELSDKASSIQQELMEKHGAYMVTLAGDHKNLGSEAADKGVLAVITMGKQVLDMPSLYESGGAFELGLGVLGTYRVLNSFNTFLPKESKLSLLEFRKALVINYLATLQLLNKLGRDGNNIAILQ